MHELSTRIEYDSYIPGLPPGQTPPTEKEKALHEGEQRVFHVIAIFFLLAHLNLNQCTLGPDELSMQLNDVGRLGTGISEGILHTLDNLNQTEQEKNNESTLS